MNDQLIALLLIEARRNRPGQRPLNDLKTTIQSDQALTKTITGGEDTLALPAPDRDMIRLWLHIASGGLPAGAIVELRKYNDGDITYSRLWQLRGVPSAVALLAQMPVVGGELFFGSPALTDVPSRIKGHPPFIALSSDSFKINVANVANPTTVSFTQHYIDYPR